MNVPKFTVIVGGDEVDLVLDRKVDEVGVDEHAVRRPELRVVLEKERRRRLRAVVLCWCVWKEGVKEQREGGGAGDEAFYSFYDFIKSQ